MSSNQRISPRVFCIPFSRRRVGLFFYAPDILYTLRPSWFMLAVLQRPWALCVEFSRAVSESVRSHTPVYISRGLAVCRARVKKNFFHRRHDYFHFFFFFFVLHRHLTHLPSPSSTLQGVSRMPGMGGGGGKEKKKEKKKRKWGGDKPESQGEGGKGNRADYPNTVIKGEMCFSSCQDD